MISVELLKEKDDFKGFKIKGHANSNIYGKDIVCAAVSILSVTCVNTLDYYNEKFKFNDNGKIMELLILNPNKNTQVILKNFEIGILSLLENKEYSKYIVLNTMEV
ncbi:MAG: ribosomal-processing cysteine protease Prp [Peptoniphilaceae bacterium]|nr:ribosomal-processing cysteine protease Prp [Peptoniphilaceae bacterium]MDD7383473.1 ribosomal-processing cysteine protease Prp [Peptoniphilaceae bacterium]MDY3738465.1 ribosomal-processing cysteine protease Prp [Peptoniphilaceae bacterium]